MTAITHPGAPSAARHLTGKVTFPRVVRSEWIKLRSLRSTVWALVLTFAASWGLAALLGMTANFGSASRTVAQQAAILAQGATFGVFFAQLIVAVIGALVITGEYSTGMIRSTLAAVPTRLPAFFAKASILFVATFVVGLISTLGSLAIVTPVLAAQGIHGSLTDPNVYLPILGASLYLAVIAVFAFGIGTVVRSSAGAIAGALGGILLLPIVFLMIPATWAKDVAPYLLMNSGFNSFGLHVFSASSPLDTWQQVLVTFGWAALTLIPGAILLAKRDA
jgi:ABC-2 type transport system permease protein